jgi:hypothetical protein
MSSMSRVIGASFDNEGLTPQRAELLSRSLRSLASEDWAGGALDRFMIALRNEYRDACIWLLIETDKKSRELWRIRSGKLEAFPDDDPQHAQIIARLLK